MRCLHWQSAEPGAYGGVALKQFYIFYIEYSIYLGTYANLTYYEAFTFSCSALLVAALEVTKFMHFIVFFPL